MQTTSFRTWLSALCLAVFLLLPSAAFAEVRTVEADGYYTVGDGAEENFSVARERAKQDAMGRAAEMAAVYVEKSVAVKNHQLTASEVCTLAAKVLKVQDAIFENTAEGNVFKIRCHVVAIVDDEHNDVFDSLLSDRKELKESLRREQEKDAQIAELNRQMEELKHQAQVAKSDEQRARIQQQAKANDTKFTATQWLERGIREYEEGDYERAGSSLEKAITLDSNSYQAYSMLSRVYLEKARSEQHNEEKHEAVIAKAMQCANKALAINSNNPTVYDILAQIYDESAQVFMNSGKDYRIEERKAEEKRKKSIEYLKKAISLDPSSPIFHNDLGVIYMHMVEFENAVTCFTKAINLDPYDCLIYLNRGRSYYQLNRKKKAKQDFEKAYELNPTDHSAKYWKEQSERW